jgi:tetratricopeptide (TPR) repeat protein
LSLINADWYILQLKNKMAVPMNLSDEQIKWVKTRLPNGREIKRPAKPYFDPIRKKENYLYPYVDRETRSLVRLQDVMIERIVLANQWKYPIYFSSTVPSGDRIGLDNHLMMEGLVLRVVKEEGENMVNAERSHSLLHDVYRYDGSNDINVEKDGTAANLLAYIPERFINLATYYLNNGETQKATVELKKAIELTPDYFRPYVVLAQIYNDSGEPEKGQEVMGQGTKHLERLTKKRPEVVLYKTSLAFLYQYQGDIRNAERVLREAFDLFPKWSLIQESLVNIYKSTQESDKAREVLEKWLRYNPHDQKALNTLNRLNEMK